jgi:hypothetical protein
MATYDQLSWPFKKNEFKGYISKLQLYKGCLLEVIQLRET